MESCKKKKKGQPLPLFNPSDYGFLRAVEEHSRAINPVEVVMKDRLYASLGSQPGNATWLVSEEGVLRADDQSPTTAIAAAWQTCDWLWRKELLAMHVLNAGSPRFNTWYLQVRWGGGT